MNIGSGEICYLYFLQNSPSYIYEGTDSAYRIHNDGIIAYYQVKQGSCGITFISRKTAFRSPYRTGLGGVYHVYSDGNVGIGNFDVLGSCGR